MTATETEAFFYVVVVAAEALVTFMVLFAAWRMCAFFFMAIVKMLDEDR